MRTLFLLLFAHFLCDYPLQGDFLARGKNHRRPLPGVPWYQCLTAHAFIHAGAVYLVTGSSAFALIELVMHWVIDYAKSDTDLSFNTDQMLHVAVKLFYVIALWRDQWAHS